jgi:hypothetical protein
MSGHVTAYRGLVRLYPKGFRREYTDDLAQTFEDLLADLGPARTWRRTAVDLLVTLPRYRLETVMNPHQTNTALFVATGVTVALAAVGVLTGGVPGGPIWLIAAVLLAVASASRLARSTRPPDARKRRHLLRSAAVLAIVCVVSTTAFWIELGASEDWNGGKLLVYNAVFFATAIGSLLCLFIGLRTPRGASGRTVISAAG